ncbi:MAG: IS630 transposase-related protein [Candidatus Competibacter phosphatis]
MATSTDRPTRGRRSKLTPEVREKVLVALRAGNYIETAAEFAGIDRATLFRWLARGRKARSGQFCDFCDAVQAAIAQAEVAAVADVVKASQTDWRAAAWLLERGPAHQRWRPSLQLKLGDLSDAEIQAALDEVARRLAGPGDAAAGGDEESE